MVPQQTLWFIHVIFEQGRGQTGVPKTWIPYLVGHPNDLNAQPEVVTLVRIAVQSLRAGCADANTGHGKDLMPGADDEYQLHDIAGKRILEIKDIKWVDVPGGGKQSEMALTWKNPADLLIRSLA